MRTTLDIDDDAYRIAKAISRDKDQGLGRTISEIILDFARPKEAPASRVVVKDGLPFIRVGRVVTNEDVRRILDESE